MENRINFLTEVSIKKILITGVPGTGKTYLGDYLKSQYWEHINMESKQDHSFLGNLKQFVSGLNTSTVITWGFCPLNNVNQVLSLKQQGFFLVWLDGNRWASLKAFIERGTVPEINFYLQMFNIERTKIIQQIQPQASINPFNDNGTFRDVKDIANELFEKISD